MDRRFAVQRFPAEVVILEDANGLHSTFASAWEKARRLAGWLPPEEPARRQEAWR